jgi:NitT/TauT family transport system substrate-binding protein
MIAPARLLLASLVVFLVSAVAQAQTPDKVRIAIGQGGTFEGSFCELGQNAGIFRKHGIDLDVIYTSGSGETLQAVIGGSMDLGSGLGTHAVLGAFSKGAPVRIVAGVMTGANDLFWYVRADSPLKSMREANGKAVGYSTNGSSTNMIVLAFQKNFDVKFNLVAAGSAPATLTQVMSGQIDVGWSAPNFGIPQGDKIRIIARGSDVPDFREQTVRVMAVNAGALETRPDVFRRFMLAYREAIAWEYGDDPAAMQAYAKFAGLSVEDARKVREFYPRTNTNPDRIVGLDSIMAEAVNMKILTSPLTADQLRTLIQMQPAKP